MKKLIIIIITLLYSSLCLATVPVYYSVGQNTTDHKSGDPNISISSGVATFTVAQTADNLGVGDVVTYSGGTCYLKSKISTTQWNVITNLGVASSDYSGGNVTSIAHVYSSLALAESGASVLIGTANLVVTDVSLNFPCYYDTGPSAGVIVDGYTTSSTCFIRFYTPFDTSTECNVRQRHSGVWDNSKFRTYVQEAYNFEITDDIIYIEGMQCSCAPTLINRIIINLSTNQRNLHVSACILTALGAGTGRRAINFIWVGAGYHGYIWDNIVYGLNNTSDIGIFAEHASENAAKVFLYNNTVFGCTTGIFTGASDSVIKNNVCYNNTADYSGTFAAGSTKNGYKEAAATGDGAPIDLSLELQSDLFLDPNSDDFHIKDVNSALYQVGADLDEDVSLAITVDIENDTRDTLTPCIGADEYIVVAGSDWTGTIRVGGTNIINPKAVRINGKNKPVGEIDKIRIGGMDY